MLSIQQLREKRAAKAKEARKILDDAGDKLPKEAQEKVQALYDEIDQLDEQIKLIERQLELENSLEAPEEAGKKRAGVTGRSVDEETANVERGAAIFNRWIRGGERALTPEDYEFIRSQPRADQSAGDGSKGGYTVPRSFAATLLERLKAFGGVRSVATVIQMDNGNPIDWPTVDETNEEGEIVAESQEASAGEIAFGTVSIGAHKYSSKVIAVPWELLQDTAVDLLGFISRALATRLARITNRHYTTGTGVNQPRGFITAAAIGKTAAAANAITIPELVDLEHSVDPAYRMSPNVRWQFHDNTLKALKKLVDADGRPIWLPGWSSGDPDTLLRYGYTINQHMAASITNSAKTVAFGDFAKYLIRDVMAVTLLRFDDSAYAKKGQVGFLAFMRTDGDLIDASNDAIKVLQQAA